MHPQELSDFAQGPVGRGEMVNAGLLATLAETGADPFLQRYVGVGLRSRRFRFRLATLFSRFVSTRRSITGGLPQGGVL